MLIPCLLLNSCLTVVILNFHCCVSGVTESCSACFHGRSGRGRSLVKSVLCFDSGNNHFPLTWCPVTVADVFLAYVLDRAAHTPSITQQSR